MKLRLDHVAPGIASTRYRNSMVMMTIITLLCGWQLVDIRTERAGLLQQLEQGREASSPVQVVNIQPQRLSSAQQSEIKEANRILDELGRPWPALLSRLEQVASPEVALLAIRPDAAKGKLRLKGEAKDVASLLAYLQRLEAVQEMHDVVLDEHEVTEKPQDGGMAYFIRFGITAQWDRT